jgi:hypothetical protein
VLVSDPTLSMLTRASSWTVNIVAFEEGEEAKIQANLCDIVACKGNTALGVLLAGPLETKTHFTELANLDGLAGNTRIELSGTHNLTNATGKLAFSAKATFGHRRFEFVNASDLSENESSRGVWSVEAGPSLKWTSTMVTAGYRYESSYKAPEAQNVCTPASFGPVGTEVCSEVIVGGPTHKTKNLVEAEMGMSIRQVAAFRLTAAYDFTNQVTAFDLPIYVIPNASGALGGGVSLGYRSDTKQITASLFVSAFKL